jgi:adenosylcobinamide kinase/adenosylcobinamide-phosphate guanylyltransferase
MRDGSLLVLGGARSGKSRYAETVVEASALARLYIATAEPLDEEMRERIENHRRRREGGTTIEAPREIEAALAANAAPGRAILVDCLTLWLSNLLLDGVAGLEQRFAALRETIARLSGLIVTVSNEVGLGLVPDTPLGRRFRDLQGRLNQDIASGADRVVFVAAGLPLPLKGQLPK